MVWLGAPFNHQTAVCPAIDCRMDSSSSEAPRQVESGPPHELPIVATLIDPHSESNRASAPHGDLPGRYDPNKVYGFTRRFSLATLMMMMAGASLILAGMNALNISPVASGTMVLLCIATALGQVFLFGGKLPRQASLVFGAVFFLLFPLVYALIDGLSGAPGLRSNAVAVFVWMVFGGLFGAIPGYLAGCAVAGILLVMDLTESMFARWRKVSEPDDDPWPPPKSAPQPESAPTPRDGA
jgi:hypothetical protein